ncbi:MAG: hypothetical protein RLZZ292_2028 [Bacteroidota bacterium]|jgi:glucan phosphoethanolaminetransferase (alkaline phosphatase superfamily)
MLPKTIGYITKVYLLGFFFFTLFRLFFLSVTWTNTMELPQKLMYLSKALLMGMRFDTVVSGYILAIPYIILCLVECKKEYFPRVIRFMHYTILFLYCIAFGICCADIPFFQYFSSRINMIVFQTTETGNTAISMILSEKRYFIYFLAFALCCFSFSKWMSFFLKNYEKNLLLEQKSTWKSYFSVLIVGILLFFGIRGNLGINKPIRIGTAFFCNYTYPNQLGLNPVFTFIKSCLEFKNQQNQTLHLMPERPAIDSTKQYLGVKEMLPISPIARPVTTTGLAKPYNVVLVMMESMSANNMAYFGNTHHLTPYLDSLALKSHFFDHFYSSGIHSYKQWCIFCYDGLPAFVAPASFEENVY